eukprot:scaffold1085_cov407-Prasinococcus_capsulatus_cf.AAC.10
MSQASMTTGGGPYLHGFMRATMAHVRHAAIVVAVDHVLGQEFTAVLLSQLQVELLGQVEILR